MLTPRISIGLPFVNNRATLPTAIRSVFAQSVTDWELILVDDGSVDGSLDLASSITDPRVTVVSDGGNAGLPARLNQITAAARADYIARMDADDIMVPDRLAAQISFLDRHPGVDVVGSAAYIIDAASRISGIQFGVDFDASASAGFVNGAFLHPTVTARRRWMTANPYDPVLPYAQDKELWLRTQPDSVFANLPAPLLFYRLYGHFSLRKYRAQRRVERLVLRRYGASRIGHVATFRSLSKSLAKECAYSGAAVLGADQRLQSLLNRRRSRPLVSAEMDAAHAILDAIAVVALPGFSDS